MRNCIVIFLLALAVGCARERSGESFRVTTGPTETLDEKRVLEIARQAVATYDTWLDHAEFETPNRHLDGSWGVIVWRLPKVPEGNRVILIDARGQVTDYLGGGSYPRLTHELANESNIRNKIVGKWSAENFEGVGMLTVDFYLDGLVRIHRPGSPDRHAAWRADGSWLVVTDEKDTMPSNSLGYWCVWHIDDHELVFRRGFSTAGPPERFTR